MRFDAAAESIRSLGQPASCSSESETPRPGASRCRSARRTRRRLTGWRSRRSCQSPPGGRYPSPLRGQQELRPWSGAAVDGGQAAREDPKEQTDVVGAIGERGCAFAGAGDAAAGAFEVLRGLGGARLDARAPGQREIEEPARDAEDLGPHRIAELRQYSLAAVEASAGLVRAIEGARRGTHSSFGEGQGAAIPTLWSSAMARAWL